MIERLSDRLRDFLKECEGKQVDLRYLRQELRINPDEPAWSGIREQMRTFVREKIVRPSGRNDGVFWVVKQVKPVPLFSVQREKIPPFKLMFPKYDNTGMELDFAEHITFREGDILTLAGKKNKGKTILCMNFTASNADIRPVLMGNEYTRLVGEKYEPDQRFLNRLQHIDGVEWLDDEGNDKVTLLPVKGDYAEHIVPDRLNIIDWINLDANQLYDISKVMEDIKANLGRGVAIIALQKGEGDAGRGGQFTKDFTSCEILLDSVNGSEDILLTVGVVKEATKPIMGKTYIFNTWNGARITNFREVVKCHTCYGKGWKKSGNSSLPCDNCERTGYINK